MNTWRKCLRRQLKALGRAKRPQKNDYKLFRYTQCQTSIRISSLCCNLCIIRNEGLIFLLRLNPEDPDAQYVSDLVYYTYEVVPF
ncbi:hypothetical protein FGO68_gene123 [Halteria grandinella]|uniref:Uncharacterized protein n=1 Tax=Halteria grandinella TaxID=5974 RepID=A0A8J8N9C3_HALGN|nr:hypothetical protein FGO68_gene123 [Halteria grandinella]